MKALIGFAASNLVPATGAPVVKISVRKPPARGLLSQLTLWGLGRTETYLYAMYEISCLRKKDSSSFSASRAIALYCPWY